MISELHYWLGMANGQRSLRQTCDLAMTAIEFRNITEEARLLATEVLAKAALFANHPVALASELKSVEMVFRRLMSEVSAIAYAPTH